MVTQKKVLKFVATQGGNRQPVSYRELVEEFGLSPEAACGHLERLWRARLIEALTPRRTRFRFRLEPGENVRELRFRLAGRGQARLRWYRHKEDKEGWPFSLFGGDP